MPSITFSQSRSWSDPSLPRSEPAGPSERELLLAIYRAEHGNIVNLAHYKAWLAGQRAES